jgi:hypothetical protein
LYLKPLNLGFQSVDALRELLPALLIPLAKSCGTACTHQGDNRQNDDKAEQAKPKQCAEKFQYAFHW